MNKPKSVFIIAEAGVNHNGSLDLALELIDCAAAAGADAVKFQSFNAEKSLSRFAPKAPYQLKTTNKKESQLEMVKKLELNKSAHLKLAAHCRKQKIEFMSTPFDAGSVDLLIDLGVKRLKIASGELTNGPLLLKIAQAGLPLIVSTGMSTLGEVETALGVLAFGLLNAKQAPSKNAFTKAFISLEGQAILNQKAILLHCTTEYPAPFAEVNLKVMNTLQTAFRLPVGLSDHTEGIMVPIAAVARGALVIEKHFTLDRNSPGPDHKASLEPDELKTMVKAIRQEEEALGSEVKMPSPSEIKNRDIARRSLVAAKDIRKGEIFTPKNLTVKRPGSGISPMKYWEYLGQQASRDYKMDEVIG